MSGTVGVRVSTTEISLATLRTSEDGAPVPTTLVRAISPGRAIGDLLTDVIVESGAAGAHVVVDASPVLDAWVTGVPDESCPHSPLGRVTVVRVSPSQATVADPFDGWPTHLGLQLRGGWAHLVGGADLHGGRVLPSDASTIGEALQLAEQHQSVALCVSAMGALIDTEVEYRVADQLLRMAPESRVVLAHETGGRRFLEREKSAILGASLLPATSGLIAELEAATSRTGSTLSLVGADGARLGVEDARAVPTRLLGSTNSLVAQGAAAIAGVATSVILVWLGDQVRLLTMEEGVLRTRMVRRSAHLGDLRFSQRHAVQSILTGPAVAALTRDLVEDRAIVLTRIGPASDDSGFEVLASTLLGQLSDAHVVTESPDVLAAHGARASLAQSEIVRYAVVSGSDEVRQVRNLLLQVAQGRVLAAADGPVELRTMADHCSPLSFLTTGPVLLRAHVVGFPRGTN